MKTVRSLIGAVLIAGSSVAFAAEPALLEEKELDDVTAGLTIAIGSAGAEAGAQAEGPLATTATHTASGSTGVVDDLGGGVQHLILQSGSESASFASN